VFSALPEQAFRATDVYAGTYSSAAISGAVSFILLVFFFFV
jgi:hypothetical protein